MKFVVCVVRDSWWVGANKKREARGAPPRVRGGVVCC